MSATIPHKNTWEPEHESLLLEIISSRGIFVSLSGSTQMEGNQAKMGSIVSEFNEAVRRCNKQIIACIDVLQKEYDGNMARHAAIPAGTKGKGNTGKQEASTCINNCMRFEMMLTHMFIKQGAILSQIRMSVSFFPTTCYSLTSIGWNLQNVKKTLQGRRATICSLHRQTASLNSDTIEPIFARFPSI
jgi:hypothetical protein